MPIEYAPPLSMVGIPGRLNARRDPGTVRLHRDRPYDWHVDDIDGMLRLLARPDHQPTGNPCSPIRLLLIHYRLWPEDMASCS